MTRILCEYALGPHTGPSSCMLSGRFNSPFDWRGWASVRMVCFRTPDCVLPSRIPEMAPRSRADTCNPPEEPRFRRRFASGQFADGVHPLKGTMCNAA
jgi:hypothetical protein